MPFRLLTYNIRVGGAGRVEPLARVINACAPDLVLIQEATRPAVIEQLAVLTGMTDWKAFPRQSLGYMSRAPVVNATWHRPRLSHHAYVDVMPAGTPLRLFGVHLSAVHAAWTERRRVYELRALLRSIADRREGLHVLAGDFNTLAPGARLDVSLLPLRLRPLVWLSGGRIKWRTIQTVLDAGYVDAFRLLHPDEPASPCPPARRRSGSTTPSSPPPTPTASSAATWCGIPTSRAPPTITRSSSTSPRSAPPAVYSASGKRPKETTVKRDVIAVTLLLGVAVVVERHRQRRRPR